MSGDKRVEVYETEEQQIEAFRAWFKKRGKLLLISTICILSIILGVQYWQHHMAVRQDVASQVYQAMMVAIDKQDQITATSKAKYLSTEYESCVYGTIAKLYLAKMAVQDHKLDEAKPYLESVIKNVRHVEFQDSARLRLAKILFAQGKTQEALKLLNKNVTLFQELKADILMSQNKSKEAHELYKLAQQAMLKKEINHPLLKMKLEALGEG